eukprot:5289591-Pleurochrysis_carterae.AAC.1
MIPKLTPSSQSRPRQAEQGDSSWVSRHFRKVFGIAERPRAPPSSADPAALVRAELGGAELRIDKEEDVLHLKQARHVQSA